MENRQRQTIDVESNGDALQSVEQETFVPSVERFSNLQSQVSAAAKIDSRLDDRFENSREDTDTGKESDTSPGDTASDPFAASQQFTKVQVSHYELRSEIAHGGMGVVYEAYDLKLDRTVALKLIRSGEFAS
ncbi:MAG: hypothetical protein FJ267_08545, partial [Planctomycetes bacterium]|nr:hypothetical protein [Planctomycetota bacterium]